jgi:uncharacterized DUF497 family protein
MSIFEWNEFKNRTNRRKHGVDFATDRRVFEDPNALMLQDRVAAGEDRWQAIGRAAEHTFLVVAHVVRIHGDQEIVRIISARYALKHERRRYESETQ